MKDAISVQQCIGELCYQFKLATMGALWVSRFTEAGKGDALPTFLEIWRRTPVPAATGASTAC